MIDKLKQQKAKLGKHGQSSDPEPEPKWDRWPQYRNGTGTLIPFLGPGNGTEDVSIPSRSHILKYKTRTKDANSHC